MFGLTFSPTLIKILCAVSLIVALYIGFEWAQHNAEQQGYARAQAEYVQQALVASEAARKREAALQHQLQDAQNEAKNREANFNAAADRARTELDGVRDELTAISDRLSRASAESLRRYAAAANDVLRECASELTAMARTADRHASDSLMLQQAWPKK